MKKLFVTSLCCLALWATPASAVYGYTDDNPFVEAMLRMMDVFGLIDRSRSSLGAPYLPAYGAGTLPGSGALGGAMGAYPALSGLGGISPLTGMGMPMTGTGMLPGYSMMPGVGGWPGTMGMPLTSPLTGLNPGAYAQGSQPWATQQPKQTALDGIWELNKGGLVIIRGNRARFYASREKYQDYVLGYDRDFLWWAPQSGGTRSRYRYRMQDDRMVLADSERNVLLLRRRR